MASGTDPGVAAAAGVNTVFTLAVVQGGVRRLGKGFPLHLYRFTL